MKLSYFKTIDFINPLLLAVVLITALAPFISASKEMDYDSIGVVCKSYVSGDPRPYAPTRQPGSPSYDLSLAFFCKMLQAVEIEENNWIILEQWLTTLLAVVLIFIFYLDLREILNPFSSLLAAGSLILHPLFLWFAWAAVEDLPALVLGYLGFFLIRRAQQKNWIWGALILALAITAKITAYGFFIASVSYALARWEKKESAQFGLFTLILAGFLYFPALVYFKMDLVKAIMMPSHEIPFEIRPAVGWDLIRFTFLWWIPGTLFYLFQNRSLLFAKWEGKKMEAHEPLFLVLLLLGYFSIYSFHKIFILCALVAFVLWIGEGAKKGIAVFFGSPSWLHTVVLILVTIPMLLTPYSRSYFLLALPSALFLLGLKFKSHWFWLAMLLVSYIPMFYYFEVRIRPPFFELRTHGYYRSHLEGRTNEYNDGGMYHVPVLWGF